MYNASDANGVSAPTDPACESNTESCCTPQEPEPPSDAGPSPFPGPKVAGEVMGDIEVASTDNPKRKAREYPVPGFSVDRGSSGGSGSYPTAAKLEGNRVRLQNML